MSDVILENDIAVWMADFVVAQPAPSIPEGWKLVPVEPTEKMKHAGRAAAWSNAVAYNETRDIYKAMLAAAPEAKP